MLRTVQPRHVLAAVLLAAMVALLMTSLPLFGVTPAGAQYGSPATHQQFVAHWDVEQTFSAGTACLTEDVYLTGSFHQTNGITITGTTPYRYIVNQSGSTLLTGIGLTTGTEYRYVSAYAFPIHYTIGGNAQGATFTQTYRLISKGAGPDLSVRSMFHYTIDGNGIWRSSINEITVDCTGSE